MLYICLLKTNFSYYSPWQIVISQYVKFNSLLLLLLLSLFSRVRLCVTPYTAAHQAVVPGILQARTLEWAAISFSNA